MFLTFSLVKNCLGSFSIYFLLRGILSKLVSPSCSFFISFEQQQKNRLIWWLNSNDKLLFLVTKLRCWCLHEYELHGSVRRVIICINLQKLIWTEVTVLNPLEVFIVYFLINVHVKRLTKWNSSPCLWPESKVTLGNQW